MSAYPSIKEALVFGGGTTVLLYATHKTGAAYVEPFAGMFLYCTDHYGRQLDNPEGV